VKKNQYVLQIKSPDKPGIVAAIAPLLASNGCDIREAGVYGDPVTKTFFIRMRISSKTLSRTELGAVLRPLAQEMALNWGLKDLSQKMKVLVAVSKFDHCLLDLLHSAGSSLRKNHIGKFRRTHRACSLYADFIG